MFKNAVQKKAQDSKVAPERGGVGLTWRQQHGGAEQSHLFLAELQAAQVFSKVKHGAHKVITA